MRTQVFMCTSRLYWLSCSHQGSSSRKGWLERNFHDFWGSLIAGSRRSYRHICRATRFPNWVWYVAYDVEQASKWMVSWWFQRFFNFWPYSGKWSNLTKSLNIFQMGSNHQLHGEITLISCRFLKRFEGSGPRPSRSPSMIRDGKFWEFLGWQPPQKRRYICHPLSLMCSLLFLTWKFWMNSTWCCFRREYSFNESPFTKFVTAGFPAWYCYCSFTQDLLQLYLCQLLQNQPRNSENKTHFAEETAGILMDAFLMISAGKVPNQGVKLMDLSKQHFQDTVAVVIG